VAEPLLSGGTDVITRCIDIAGRVAAMTENELDVASEKFFHNTLGGPGQRHEVGKAVGGLV